MGGEGSTLPQLKRHLNHGFYGVDSSLLVPVVQAVNCLRIDL